LCSNPILSMQIPYIDKKNESWVLIKNTLTISSW
jgi:hypothetical protein